MLKIRVLSLPEFHWIKVHWSEQKPRLRLRLTVCPRLEGTGLTCLEMEKKMYQKTLLPLLVQCILVANSVRPVCSHAQHPLFSGCWRHIWFSFLLYVKQDTYTRQNLSRCFKKCERLPNSPKSEKGTAEWWGHSSWNSLKGCCPWKGTRMRMWADSYWGSIISVLNIIPLWIISSSGHWFWS